MTSSTYPQIIEGELTAGLKAAWSTSPELAPVSTEPVLAAVGPASRMLASTLQAPGSALPEEQYKVCVLQGDEYVPADDPGNLEEHERFWGNARSEWARMDRLEREGAALPSGLVLNILKMQGESFVPQRDPELLAKELRNPSLSIRDWRGNESFKLDEPYIDLTFFYGFDAGFAGFASVRVLARGDAPVVELDEPGELFHGTSGYNSIELYNPGAVDEWLEVFKLLWDEKQG